MSDESPWRLSWRADPVVRALADRHYNRQKVGAAQFVPPGRCLVMLTADKSALWVTSWPYPQYVRHAWAGAWVCSLFRNEGTHLSSDLIRAAVAHTRAHWPDAPELGMVTFVDERHVRPKAHPGYCYLRAGWQHTGRTAAGLHVLQQLPAQMPPAADLPGAAVPLFPLPAAGAAA